MLLINEGRYGIMSLLISVGNVTSTKSLVDIILIRNAKEFLHQWKTWFQNIAFLFIIDDLCLYSISGFNNPSIFCNVMTNEY